MNVRLVLILLMSWLLAGCLATTPTTVTHQKPSQEELDKRAAQHQQRQQDQAPANGAIYQANSNRPIFEDRRARNIGDNLTIMITERTNATTSGTERGGKSVSVQAAAPSFLGINMNRMAASAESSREFDESAARTANNLFQGTIAVTVIDITPSGNLVVSGEKQIAMDSGSEFVRFSGVVDPKDITIGNRIASTSVAEARVEYRTNTSIDKAEVISKIARFFFSVLPF
jgi:flagellar L-ring protein precursor FlgH